MGPTTGKTTYAKNNFNIVDIDPLTKDTRKRVAGELGMDFRDPRVSASPVYQQAVVDDVVNNAAAQNANQAHHEIGLDL